MLCASGRLQECAMVQMHKCTGLGTQKGLAPGLRLCRRHLEIPFVFLNIYLFLREREGVCARASGRKTERGRRGT